MANDDELLELLLHQPADAPPRKLRDSESRRLSEDVEAFIAAGGSIYQAAIGESTLDALTVLADGSAYEAESHRKRLVRAGEAGRISRRRQFDSKPRGE